MEKIKKSLLRLRMFSFLQGVLITTVGIVLLKTNYDIGMSVFLLIIAWSGFFTIMTEVARVLKSL